MVDVAVVGAAGYAGIEVVRLVLGHPRLHLTCATSAADAGRPIADLYPALAGVTDLAFEVPNPSVIGERAQLAFLAVPHTAALELAPALLDAGVRVMDLSADFRLRDAAIYEQWYDAPHTAPSLLESAVYGLPELDRARLADARLVAVPGCYPTATLLAAAPALSCGFAVGTRVLVDAKSGVSGAGRGATSTTHYCSIDESMVAYKVAAHRHTPEIEQGLSAAAGQKVTTTFVPHLVPMDRGLLSTVYLDAAEGLTEADLHAAYANAYADEPFVHVHEARRMPATSEVRGSNRAHLGLALDERTRTIVVGCAIDNLGKGAAGQAVQCANAALGWDETEGLMTPGPVV